MILFSSTPGDPSLEVGITLNPTLGYIHARVHEGFKYIYLPHFQLIFL